MISGEHSLNMYIQSEDFRTQLYGIDLLSLKQGGLDLYSNILTCYLFLWAIFVYFSFSFSCRALLGYFVFKAFLSYPQPTHFLSF